MGASMPADLTDSIAIVGMAGRFPGASTLQEFWQNLAGGVESITFFKDADFPGLPQELLDHPQFVKARGMLDGIEWFDAGFFGYTRRGPIGIKQRVEGWRGYAAVFGGLTADATTPYAMRGYFDNGGEIAHVVRLAVPGAKPACAKLEPGPGTGLPGSKLVVSASSPGAWANNGEVTVDWRRRGATGKAEVDVTVRIEGELVEYLIGLDPGELITAVAAGSRLVRFAVAEDSGPAPLAAGPQRRSYQVVLREELC